MRRAMRCRSTVLRVARSLRLICERSAGIDRRAIERYLPGAFGLWISARQANRPAALGDSPGGQPGQPDRELAGALDETERERRIGR